MKEIDMTSLVGDVGLLNKLESMLQSIHWYESKTVWFNILVTILGIVTSLQGIATFDKYAQVLGLFSVIGNVVLRVWFTSAPIASSSTSTLQ